MRPLDRRRFLASCIALLGWPKVARADPELSRLIDALELVGPAQPQRAPPFRVPSLAGGSITDDDLAGRAVLVHFWTTWCQPCRWELPLLEQLYRQHRDEGFVVLAISIDPSREVVAKYVTEREFTFPIGLDPDREIGDRFRVMGVPGTFIVGRDGDLKAKGFGPREWDRQPAHALIRALLSTKR